MWLLTTTVLLAIFITASCNFDEIGAKLEEIENEFRNLQKDIESVKAKDENNGHVILDDIIATNEAEDVQNLEEGDIAIPEENGDETGIEKRNAVRGSSKLWKSRVIPYEFVKTGASALSTAYQDTIKTTLTYMASISCLTFPEKTSTDTHYLQFHKGGGCWSFVGKTSKSPQKVSIGQGCASQGIIMHEVLHALGFYHEQSRYDRDEYIEIKYENIKPGRENNFRKKTIDTSRNVGTGYDYASIMHYSAYGFSKNGRKTIVINANKNTNNLGIGQRSSLTADDIGSLNRLYHCTNTPALGSDWTVWSAWGVCHQTNTDTTMPCTRRKHRFCPIGYGCPGLDVESSDCSDANCKRDGHWGHWGAWNACTAAGPCIKGTKTRSRQCDNPKPRKGGNDCPGPSATDTVECEGLCHTNCSFNENTCGYIYNGTWRVGYGSTRSTGTGPSADVSADTGVGGNYLYTEASSPAKAGDTSVLTSPKFTFTGSQSCYSFRYHMYGANGDATTFGSLSLSVAGTQLWSKAGPQGNQWHKKSLTVTSATPFQVVFKAIRGTTWRGDTALDNLVITPGQCGANEGTWGLWTSWTTCTISCGGSGTRSRSRVCDSGSQCLKTDGTSGTTEAVIETCGTNACPVVVNGGWGRWIPGLCSLTCGGGTLTKTRTCDNPLPSNGGLLCLKSDGTLDSAETLTDACSTQVCPTPAPGSADISGNWSSGLGASLTFVQTGTTITGTFTPNRQTFPMHYAQFPINGNIGTGSPTSLGFAVSYQGVNAKDKSTCVWAGQLLKIGGVDTIYTSWLMSNAVYDMANAWNSTTIGKEEFFRPSTGPVTTVTTN